VTIPATDWYANLRLAIFSMNADHWDLGESWWAKARDDVLDIGREFGIREAVIIPAAAAVSPGIRWTATLQNLRRLCRALPGPMPSGPGAGLEVPYGYRHCERAWAILTGSDPGDVLAGQKVTALARNLAGDLSVACVDRHILAAASGGRLAKATASQKEAISAVLARLGLERQLAGQPPVPAAAIQAALWLRRNSERSVCEWTPA
jgi:hypothetical protein